MSNTLTLILLNTKLVKFSKIKYHFYNSSAIFILLFDYILNNLSVEVGKCANRLVTDILTHLQILVLLYIF